MHARMGKLGYRVSTQSQSTADTVSRPVCSYRVQYGRGRQS